MIATADKANMQSALVVTAKERVVVRTQQSGAARTASSRQPLCGLNCCLSCSAVVLLVSHDALWGEPLFLERKERSGRRRADSLPKECSSGVVNCARARAQGRLDPAGPLSEGHAPLSQQVHDLCWEGGRRGRRGEEEGELRANVGHREAVAAGQPRTP